jgi:periplasmic protein TonB
MSATAKSPFYLPSFLSQHRIIMIAAAVLMFHAVAIWALQSGLLMRAVEMVVPVTVLGEIIEPPKPAPPLQPPVAPKETPPPVKQVVAKPAVVKPAPPVPQKQAPPQILAVETPTPNAPAPVQTSVQSAPVAPVSAPSSPVAAVATPAAVSAQVPSPAPVVKVQPSTDADDLYNPNKRYPRMSITMGEQGVVMVRILIGANGLPIKAELQKTSGFERLDQAALEFVMQSRYKPGTLNGVANEMWMGRTVTYNLAK